MSHKTNASSEEREVKPRNPTKQAHETNDQVNKDFDRRSAEAVRMALGTRACQL